INVPSKVESSLINGPMHLHRPWRLPSRFWQEDNGGGPVRALFRGAVSEHRLGSFEGQGGLQNVTDDRLFLQNQIFGAANEPGAKKVRILGKTKPSKVFQMNTPIPGV